MNCINVESMIRLWEEGYPVSPSEMENLKNHLTSCPSCRAAYSLLTPLLERDTRESVDPLFAEIKASSDLTDRVMDRVGRAGVRFTGRSRSDRRPGSRLLPYAAAAVFIIGLASLLYFRFSGDTRNTVVVRFELSAPQANSVSLVGDFTEWEPFRLMMKDSDGDGVWEIGVRLQKGSSYTYNFIIDREIWITDPNALIHVKDGFGGESSVMSL